MSFNLYDKQAFINAATSAEKPVAFLVGSPLSVDAGGGVPGIGQILSLARDEVMQRKSKVVDVFDRALEGKSGATAYQEALRWLHGNFGQNVVNKVIQRAVLMARLPGVSKLDDADGHPADWHLPEGTRQLAELICCDDERFPGPVLTTNFDPLLSLAVKATGGNIHRRIIDSDGDLGRTAESDPGTYVVAHLHGYWRGSDTLHTPEQLVSGRPKLRASLQNLLRQRTLIVVAYAGWDDVFTKALVALLDDDEAKLDVIWCFYESDPLIVQTRYAALIEKLKPAITRGRFRAYGGIDCHTVFGEIAAEIRPVVVSACISVPLVSPFPGWHCIDATALDALPPLTEAEALRYYDGAIPTWRHALSDQVPRREILSKIVAYRANLPDDAGSLQLISAAGGEGKSTLLLQAAVDAARNEGVRILWRPSSRIGYSVEQILSLDVAHQWLIVVDDADNLVNVIAESAYLLYTEHRANVDFLLAARDTDWKAAGGGRQPWAQWLQYESDVVLRGIGETDANAVVAAWARAGQAGLRNLSAEADPVRRANALVRAVKDATSEHGKKLGDGSFFGGLLAVRFGEAGLRAHVRDFLVRLRDIPIQGSSHSLADALLYVAACHGAGIPGIDENVLADLLEVPRDWIGSRVVRRLGEEAVAVAGGKCVYTRHSQVAAAILLEAELALDVDLTEVWARLVRQTVRAVRELTLDNRYFSGVLHAGPKLQLALPNLMLEERRKAIALAASLAHVNVDPDRLAPLVDLGKTYRKAGKTSQAIDLFRTFVNAVENKVDFADNVRGYWYEWGVCEGEIGKENKNALANAWICSLALSDHLNPASVSDVNIKLICSGLGIAFGKLATRTLGCPYAHARRAVAYLGRQVPIDSLAVSYFDHHDREADALGTSRPKDSDEAVAWLAAGADAVGKALNDPFLTQLIQSEKIFFVMLRVALR